MHYGRWYQKGPICQLITHAMNSKIAAEDAALSVHAGDFPSESNMCSHLVSSWYYSHIFRVWASLFPEGSQVGPNKRCDPYSFASRREIFSAAATFFIVPGENDWNECYGYDINSNTDSARELWRNHFAESTSSFHQYRINFHGVANRKILARMATPRCSTLNATMSPFVELNAEWVEDRLSLDVNCQLRAIVIIT